MKYIKKRAWHPAVVCTLMFLFSFIPSGVLAGSTEALSLTISQDVIARSLKILLPLDFVLKDELGGTIRCTSIDNVSLSRDRIKFFMTAEIRDFSYTLTMMSKSVILNVGSVKIDLACETELRFRDGTLYLTPSITGRPGAPQDPNIDAILPLLQELFSNREYAIKASDLDSVDSRIGNTIFNLGMHITEVVVGDRILTLRGTPEIKRLREVTEIEKNN